MPEIKNTFLKGRMNKDLDERLIPNGEYKDALNIEVSTSEDSEVGTVQTILGNTRVDSLVPSGIVDGYKCVGSISDEKTNKLYWFVKSDPNGTHAIIEYDLENSIESLVFVDKKANTDNSVLGFPNRIITGINIIDNLLFWTDGVGEPKKINIDRCKQGTTSLSTHTRLIVEGQDVGDVEEENITVIKKKPTKAPTAIPIFTTSTNSGPSPSLFEKTFSRFSYRYKYQDGEYSAFGPFSNVVFNPEYVENKNEGTPGNHPSYDKNTSYNTKEPFNATMINKINKIKIFDFIAPDMPKDVVEVELLYKQEDSPVVYSVAKLNVFENNAVEGFSQGRGNSAFYQNSEYKGRYDIVTENIYAALPENQFIRVFDTVPKYALAQEITGNRIVYGNYTQNYTIENNIEIDVGYEDRANFEKVLETGLGSAITFNDSPLRSLKSLRNYQVGVVFGDKYGRETPVFTSRDSAAQVLWFQDNQSVPNASRSLSLKAMFDSNFNYPTWASYFKFYVKETSTDYHNLIMDKAYVATTDDDERNVPSTHVWISLFSSDRNKVQEDDFLILKNILKDNFSDQVQTNNRFKIIDIKNEAPESIKYDYNVLAIIDNQTGSAKALDSNGTATNNLMDVDGHKINEDTDMLHLDESVYFSIDGTHLEFNDTNLSEDTIYVSWYDTNTAIYSSRYKARDIRVESDVIYVKLNRRITTTDQDLAKTDANGNSGALANIGPNIVFQVEQKTPRQLDQFAGRFFAKIAFNYLGEEIQGSSAGQIINALTTLVGANIKHWQNETSTTSYDQGEFITNYNGLGTASTNSAATGLSEELHETITNTEADWDILRTEHTGFFIDSMYLCAGQLQPQSNFAKSTGDVIRGMSGADLDGGTSYSYAQWSDDLDTPIPNPFLYDNGAFNISLPTYGPDINKNYMDYAMVSMYSGNWITSSTGGYIQEMAGGASAKGGVINPNNANVTYGHSSPQEYSIPTLASIETVPLPNPPTWRWKPFAKDANAAGGYEWIKFSDGFTGWQGSTFRPNQALVLKTHSGPDLPTTGPASTQTYNNAIGFPTASWTEIPKSIHLGSNNGVIDGEKIVNGLEGVVVTTAEHTIGSRKWTTNSSISITGTLPSFSWSSGINQGNVQINTTPTDEVYGVDGDEGRVYMHLSFLAPGKDLVPDSLDLSGAEITGPDCIGKYLQGIHGGGIFTKDAKDAADNGADFGTAWNSPRIIECETSSNNTSNVDIGYNASYQTLHDNQWKPTEAQGLSAAEKQEINTFIQNINAPNAQFRFSNDNTNTVYIIKSVQTQKVYNHTPWKRRYVVDSSETGNTFTDPYGLNQKMVQGGDSVEEAAVEWAKNKGGLTTVNTLSTLTTNLEDKIKAFGKSSNRRLVYIIELDKSPIDTGNYNFVDGSNITTDSLAELQFVNPVPGYVSGGVSHTPAIWETEPKKNTDLDIYYEASDAIPTSINEKTRELFAPVGCRVDFPNKPEVTNGEFDIAGPIILRDWTGPAQIKLGTGINKKDSNNVVINYAGAVVRFTKLDGSYATAVVAAQPSGTGNAGDKIRYINLQPKPEGKFGLSWYNCFCLGNGIESNRIRDDFNQMKITNGARASSVLEEPYQEEHRKNGLIYSGIYNSTSNTNNLNQFIIGEKITKDLNPTYGSIQKLFQRRVSLVAFCQDKVVSITSNKDALFNADGTPQLISSTNVLGDATPFIGDYGISNNPESFASESYRAYFADKQRGVVLRLSRDGLTPISDIGMRDYFRDELILSRSLLGTYDAYSQLYNLTLLQTPSTYNLVRNSYLDVGVEPLLAPNSFPHTNSPEYLHNTNLNDSTPTNYPLPLPWSSSNDYSSLNFAGIPNSEPSASDGFGLRNQNLTTRISITEYEPIPQGHFSQADNSGATNPGSGQPGDPGVVAGTGSIPPVYNTSTTAGHVSATDKTMFTFFYVHSNTLQLNGLGDFFATNAVGGARIGDVQNLGSGHLYLQRHIDGVQIFANDQTIPRIQTSNFNGIFQQQSTSSPGRVLFYKLGLGSWDNSYVTTAFTNPALNNLAQTINPVAAQIPGTTTDVTVMAGEIINLRFQMGPSLDSEVDPYGLAAAAGLISSINPPAGNPQVRVDNTQGYANGFPNDPSLPGHFKVKVELLRSNGDPVPSSMFDTDPAWTSTLFDGGGDPYENGYNGNTGAYPAHYAYDNTFTTAPTFAYGSGYDYRYSHAKIRIYWKFKDWVDHSTSSSPYSSGNNGNIAIEKLRVRIRFINVGEPNDHVIRIHTSNFQLSKHTFNRMEVLGTTGASSSPAVPETFDVPSSTVPGWVRVNYKKSNKAIDPFKTDWNVASSPGNVVYPRGGLMYGPQTATGVASEHGYHWRIPTSTNNVTTYQGLNYDASQVRTIISPPSPSDSLSYTGVPNSGFGPGVLELNRTNPNLDPVTGQNAYIYVADKISINNVGQADTYITQTLTSALTVSNWYLIDVVLEAGTTVPAGFCYIQGVLPASQSIGSTPNDSGYPDGYFGTLSPDPSNVFTNPMMSLYLEPINRHTDTQYGVRSDLFDYEPSGEANVLRAIFQIDPAGAFADAAETFQDLNTLKLSFNNFNGEIEAIRLIDVTTDNNGASPDAGTVSLGVNGGLRPQDSPNYHNYLKHLLTPMGVYIGASGSINFSSEPWIYGIRRGTGGFGSGWNSNQHRATQYIFQPHGGTGVQEIAPTSTYAGYEFTFEVGPNELTNTFAGILSGYVIDAGDGSGNSYGFRAINIDMPGTYKVIGNLGNNTTLATGETPKIQINVGNGFVDPNTVGSSVALEPNYTRTTGNWGAWDGAVLFLPDGINNAALQTIPNPADHYQYSIKSVSLIDRTNYVSTPGSIGSWSISNQDSATQNLYSWSNGTIQINSPYQNPIQTGPNAGAGVYIKQDIIDPNTGLVADLVTGHKYRLSFTYTELPDNQSGFRMYYYNSQNEGFAININPSGTGTYSQVHTIGEQTSSMTWSGSRQRLFIYASDNNLYTRYLIDNITLERVVDLTLNKTISFSEDSKGWVSFKSFVPESGLSLSKRYFTIWQGGLWQHNLGNYSEFYNKTKEPHLTTILNAEPSVIKSFRTLNYEGSQAKIVGYGEEIVDGNTLSDISFSNLIDKNGWYVDNIVTNKQEGFVPDFIEKEGKWFNYIKGTKKDGNLQTSYISQHTGDFSFQGIGEIDNAQFSQVGLTLINFLSSLNQP